MDIQKAIIEEARKIKFQKGITYEQFGRKVGVHPSYASEILSEKKKPSNDAMRKLGEFVVRENFAKTKGSKPM